MTILITGGAGYIGSHTARLLQEMGRDVVVLDTLERGYRDAVEGIDLVVGDIADTRLVGKICRKFDVDSVIHFAAYKAVGESMTEPLRYYRNNVAGSISLVEALLEHDVKQIVFSSTAAVYGNPDASPVNEEAPLRPESVYAQTKADIEQFLASCTPLGLRSVSLRYFNAAGAHESGDMGEDWAATANLVPFVMKVLFGAEPALHIFGDDYPTPDGSCIRDYVHVSDLADAHIKALDYLSGGGKSIVCNVGTGQGTSVKQLVSVTESVTGRALPHQVVARRAGDPAAVYADPTLIRAVLGWRATRDLREIISSAYRWHERHPDGYDR
ncbi:MAG: UDP-glucose 4-epimerase GalE [Actinomycetota bacterium]